MREGASDAWLAVDLDGTLIRTDTLWESLLRLVRERPDRALALPIWLLGGRARFKDRLAGSVVLDVASLPYRESLLAHLRDARAAGRRIALVTAADQRLADAVGAHLDVFDERVGTGSGRNLKGETKRDWLVERFGDQGFDYVGDSSADLPVFRAARRALLVSPSPNVKRRAEAHGNVAKVFEDRSAGAAAFLRALRPHQWAKNLLLGVPLAMAHEIDDPASLARLAAAFVAFCALASGGYILNDLFDLPADRRHPQKRTRPFAAGEVSIPVGLVAAGGLLIAGFGLGLFGLGREFAAWAGLYLVANCAYSAGLKGLLLVDVLVLASLYTIRLMAGAAATGTPVSDWLLAFSLFFFLSLAFAKRHVEAASLGAGESGRVPGRGYRREDTGIIEIAGLASGYVAVMVLALYINAPKVQTLYSQPKLLWLLCPLLVYWLTRVWFLAHRGELHHDPVVFALRDPQSHAVALLAAALIGTAALT